MSYKYKIAGVSIIALFLISILSSTAMAASGQIANPPANAVSGYTLLWNNTISVNNPFNSSQPSTTVASQVWYKNDTQDNVSAVVGSIEMSIANSTLNQQVPTALINKLGTIANLNFTSGTYWDLLMACLLLSANAVNITSEIKTTDDSIAFNKGGSSNYFVLSKVNDMVIFTYSFTISNEWLQMSQSTLKAVMTTSMALMTTYLAAWNMVITLLNALVGLSSLLSSSISAAIPQAASSQPSGTYTSESDVNTVTSDLGKYYNNSIPGYSPYLVLLAIFGGFAIVFALSKKKFRK